MDDMHYVFLHRSALTTDADKALLKARCFEFNHLKIIVAQMQHRVRVPGLFFFFF